MPRLFISTLVISFLLSCSSKRNAETVDGAKPDSSEIKSTPPPAPFSRNNMNDSVVQFNYIENFTHPFISNQSGKKIDMLLNCVDDYLGGKQVLPIAYETESILGCSFEQTDSGIIFGRQLVVGYNRIYHYAQKQIADGKRIAIAAQRPHGEQKQKKFQLGNCYGRLNFQGVSCNDADFARVELSYPSGKIVIDSMINAAVFEYDIDKNGTPEQYVYGVRNCSKEMVMLRVR